MLLESNIAGRLTILFTTLPCQELFICLHQERICQPFFCQSKEWRPAIDGNIYWVGQMWWILMIVGETTHHSNGRGNNYSKKTNTKTKTSVVYIDAIWWVNPSRDWGSWSAGKTPWLWHDFPLLLMAKKTVLYFWLNKLCNQRSHASTGSKAWKVFPT